MNEVTDSQTPNSNPESHDPEVAKRKASAKWQLNMIIIVTVVPIVLAYVAYYTGWGVPDSTVNQGSILRPAAQLTDLELSSGDLPDFQAATKWRWFIPVPENCNNVCQQHFYLTRQVHIRLANKSERVERYAVNVGGSAGQAYLDGIAEEHPRLKQLQSDAKSWQNWLGRTNAPKDVTNQHYYLLIDPQGYAMMYYTQEQDGNQLLKDIKRILRHTPED